ncbi:unnamed protein product [Polarella glacialis]|uniref:Uncharacterized protein n=1 Tax=Polarella glacialis TaxID=89957 RepID=A0A813LM90_POLGL|nr:unnamed protein product [Polarella glacialis]
MAGISSDDGEEGSARKTLQEELPWRRACSFSMGQTAQALSPQGRRSSKVNNNNNHNHKNNNNNNNNKNSFYSLVRCKAGQAKPECRTKPVLKSPARKNEEAENRVSLEDWFRSTLGGQTLARVLQYDEYDEDAFPSARKADNIRTDSFELDAMQSQSPLESTSPAAARPSMTDTEVQCSPEEMLEPMARSAFFQQSCLQKIRSAPLWHDTTYSVASHFSYFEDADVVTAWVAELEESELHALADRFLGSEIAGVAVRLHSCRPARRVADRHVVEAASLSHAVPAFRTALLASAKSLLVGGLNKPPLHGRSLLRSAHECPGHWAKLAYTALDFVCRLISARALPTAFIAELLVVFADMTLTGEGCKMSVLGLLSLLRAVRPSCLVRHCRRAGRSATAPSCMQAFLDPPIPRKTSASAWVSVRTRSIGTSLRPHDDSQPYCCISTGGAPGQKVRIDIMPAIAEHLLPDYWRWAAGGEHSAEELKLLARRSEAACSPADAEAIAYAAEEGNGEGNRPQLMRSATVEATLGRSILDDDSEG